MIWVAERGERLPHSQLSNNHSTILPEGYLMPVRISENNEMRGPHQYFMFLRHVFPNPIEVDDERFSRYGFYREMVRAQLEE